MSWKVTAATLAYDGGCCRGRGPRSDPDRVTDDVTSPARVKEFLADTRIWLRRPP
jgi:hypothetical protein